MKVLVAGGAGFIGSHLVDRILRRPEVKQLLVVDNCWTGTLRNLEHINDPRLQVVRADFETLGSENGTFDEIYHLASPASPQWYMAAPLRTVSANVMGMMKAIQLLAAGGQIGFTSTSEVYGDPKVSPQPESYRGSVDCTGPRASYDESKRCAEAMLFEARRTLGIRIKVVRLFNVFGPRTRVDDGRAVSNFITQALRGVPITIYGTGDQTRSWGYVDDIVDGLAEYFWASGTDYPGPLNIGNDREIPVIDVARYIEGIIPGATIAFHPPAPDDPTNRRPDLTLARRVIPRWEAKIPYEEGVQRTIGWFKAALEAQTSDVPEPLDWIAALTAGRRVQAA